MNGILLRFFLLIWTTCDVQFLLVPHLGRSAITEIFYATIKHIFVLNFNMGPIHVNGKILIEYFIVHRVFTSVD